MKTLAGPVTSALGSAGVGIVQLVYLAFSPTPVALNLSTWDLLWSAITYKGAYGLGQISPVTDKPGEIQGITLELAAGDSARVSMALDEADTVQGTAVTIRTAIIDLATYTVLDAPVEWSGTLDTMSISEDGTRAAIRATAESKAVDLLRGNPAFYADSDQQAISAGDLFFEYVVDQIDKPVIWPAREYFFK